jgi:DNA-binding response OmpR family regulator
VTAGVLVVGHDNTVTEFLTAVMRRGGIDARPARADVAAARANDDEPALVVVDTDLAVVRSIRSLADQKKAAVPIVVLGAERPADDAAEEATAAGASHYVGRPITDALLIQGIQTILDAG